MSAMPKLLVVDDEPRGVELLQRALRKIGEVDGSPNADDAWERYCTGDYDLVISDQRMPGPTGVELLERVAQRDPFTGRILLTAYAELSSAIDSINQGRVHAYLTKPCHPDQLRATVESVLGLVQRARRVQSGIVYISAAMDDLLSRVEKVAAMRAAVLVRGETGTGKELIARALHDRGPRADRPFVAVNCGALPEELLESELFGYVRGAFTGADRDKEGLFEHADAGTLFLDEIGDTPPTFQVKLLRAIETGEIRPVGARGTKRVDVRIVSATHRDLDEAVAAGTFRQDLLYRLNALMIEVPPLRERKIDIPLLAAHFAEEIGADLGRCIKLGEDFLRSLADRSFPGNVRELRNAVERAIAFRDNDEEVGPETAKASGPELAPERLGTGTLKEQVERLERAAIAAALTRFEGNRSHAAEALGLSRPGLRQKMRRLGLA